MSWIPVIEQWIVHLATQVPLPAYVFVGEIIEELISPIPSQAVLMTAGSIAKTQDLPITVYFFWPLLPRLQNGRHVFLLCFGR
jgi:membrane protein DedA with SNARE-associated domain